LSVVNNILLNKYGFDAFNQYVFTRGTKSLGQIFYKKGDQFLIDGVIVNGTARILGSIAAKGRQIQSGYLYHYIAAMVLGLFGFLCWLLLLS
jgi:NADH-quinone oxidoreductase subunit L